MFPGASKGGDWDLRGHTPCGDGKCAEWIEKKRDRGDRRWQEGGTRRLDPYPCGDGKSAEWAENKRDRDVVRWQNGGTLAGLGRGEMGMQVLKGKEFVASGK